MSAVNRSWLKVAFSSATRLCLKTLSTNFPDLLLVCTLTEKESPSPRFPDDGLARGRWQLQRILHPQLRGRAVELQSFSSDTKVPLEYWRHRYSQMRYRHPSIAERQEWMMQPFRPDL